VRVCSMNDKSRAIVLNLCVKRTLVLTLFVYLLAACFCDHLSLPQMDSISSDSEYNDGYAPGCVSQNGYGFGPCDHIW